MCTNFVVSQGAHIVTLNRFKKHTHTEKRCYSHLKWVKITFISSEIQVQNDYVHSF